MHIRRKGKESRALPCAVTLFDASHCVSPVSPGHGAAPLISCGDQPTALKLANKTSSDDANRKQLRALAVLVGGQQLQPLPERKRRRVAPCSPALLLDGGRRLLLPPPPDQGQLPA
eukprot:Hpha_TRINITY_DN14996_c1_g2::TRINITY_DN14996_c1_g2_i1::g.144554::m.144554